MKLTFNQLMILYCLHKLQGERTIYSIYHLLQGKKSSQTIQDAHLFHLAPLFQTETNISRQQLETMVTELSNEQLIIEKAAQHYAVTEKGVKQLEKGLAETPIPKHVNGWKHQRTSLVFWERLSLAVQVISNLKKRESKYLPVQRKTETLLWIRQFLAHNRLSRDSLGKQIYQELVSCLESDPSLNPDYLVIRLTGYRSIGYTEVQAAQNFQMEQAYYHYHFLSILHYMIGHIETNPAHFPILSFFIEKPQKHNLTNSTEKTYTLLKQGHSVTDIMTIRGLKKSTIEDHLVELALNVENFTIDAYVSAEKQNLIKQAAKKLQTKQLKQIRSMVGQAGYFEIRLVLAKYGEEL
ncbi:helix-turn-helix domain-containing protein [Bacillus tuaregi]|uniref:helix-turn-helix domain-containing protein n=1 Tax=Bacillus tuaregi TaxID=1816695 RepID=UPI0008F90C0A|nr:helix-turn-helix domain-containing protein [Bacillus tuaregi]